MIKKMFCSKKRIIICIVVVVLLAAGIAGFVYYENNLVYKTCRVEAGVTVNVKDFLMKEDDKASIAKESDEIDTTVPGEYHLKIKTGLFKHSTTLIVEDTIAPELEVQDLTTGYGEVIEPEQFVTKVSDATEVEISFSADPDFKKDGDQEVEICATDLGGNVTKATAKLTIWPVMHEMTLEAGSEAPAVEAFLLNQEVTGATITTDMSTVAMNHVATYEIDIQLGENTYPVTLKVEDTVAPVIAVKDIDGFAIVKRSAADFVTECTDATDVAFSFEKDPDLTQAGTQELVVIATDEAGNSVNAPVKLTLQLDTEAPVITGAADQTTYVGRSISYRKIVQATDNCPEELNFTIDSSQVNINAPGTYPVTCVATDAAGNSTSASFNVNVIVRTYSEAEVYGMADAALASCITPDMAPADKASAIFWYVRNHLSFYDASDKSSWTKAAGEAFENHRGDCYNYACMAKALLTRAGITNMDIGRIPSGNNLHYWNLVDLGDGHGWYHFDTTPRVDGRPTILLWTDAQMMEYSNAHGNCFNYDRSAYPVIP